MEARHDAIRPRSVAEPITLQVALKLPTFLREYDKLGFANAPPSSAWTDDRGLSCPRRSDRVGTDRPCCAAWSSGVDRGAGQVPQAASKAADRLRLQGHRIAQQDAGSGVGGTHRRIRPPRQSAEYHRVSATQEPARPISPSVNGLAILLQKGLSSSASCTGSLPCVHELDARPVDPEKRLSHATARSNWQRYLRPSDHRQNSASCSLSQEPAERAAVRSLARQRYERWLESLRDLPATCRSPEWKT